jgi:diaminopimelate epimerase
MHGLGNDFVIVDVRLAPLPCDDTPTTLSAWVRALSNRHTGIGCDQCIILRAGTSTDTTPFMQIFNQDGSEVSACGNATRCVGWLLMQESGATRTHIRTAAGTLVAEAGSGCDVRVNMGNPRLHWQDIPLSSAMDTRHISYDICPDGVAVNVGNPHLVMFMEGVLDYPLAEYGARLEHAPLFPERANITVAEVQSRGHIHIRTWERGVGETLACGTAACATMVAARRRGRVDATATLQMAGGTLTVEWEGDEDHHDHPVFMTGEAVYVFRGEI